MSIKVIPVMGEKTVVQAHDGEVVEFAVDISEASVSRSENNLEITLDNGTEIHIEDFFVVAEEGALPTLVLADGSVVEATEFLKAMNPDMDLSTAAGPSASPLSSGTSYDDDGGSLIGGLDRLGDLDGFQFGSASSLGRQIDFFQPATFLGTDAPAPNPDGSEGVRPPAPVEPEATIFGYLRVGLMQVGVHDKSGELNDPRVELDVNQLTTADNPVVTINIDADSKYSVVQDPVTGKIIFKLKDLLAGEVPTSETVTVDIDGKTYLVQVGATAGSEMSDITTWPPFEEGVVDPDMAWGGLTHGHRTGESLVTPSGYEDTELHLQMRDSSLQAKAGQDASFSLKEGSLYISNEGSANYFAESRGYQHNQGLRDYGEDGGGGLKPGVTDTSPHYTSSLTTTVSSLGQGVVDNPVSGGVPQNTVRVDKGAITIESSVADISSTLHGAEAATVSSVFAGQGGKVLLEADAVHVNATGGGFGGDRTDNLHGTVSAVRADGLKGEQSHTQWGEPILTGIESSEVGIKSQGEITLSVTAQNEENDHSGLSYASVAASDRGKVHIKGQEVAISATNNAGEADLGGLYGIYAGYGLGAKDIIPYESFEYFSSYAHYLSSLQQASATNGVPMPSLSRPDGRVDVKADGDVNVNVDLGSGDNSSEASAVYSGVGGAVKITAGQNVNISAHQDGIHGEDDGKFLSAVTVDHGAVSINAAEAVNIDLRAQGDNLAVVKVDSFANYGGGQVPRDSFSEISGREVNITGKAGVGNEGGEPSNNNIAGIYFLSKKQGFVVQAEEKFSIDVQAQHNGGSTSSIGILYGGAPSSSGGTAMSVVAPLFEIEAQVLQSSGTDSVATGISLINSSFGLFGENSDSYESPFWGSDMLAEDSYGGIEHLSVYAGGGYFSTGIENAFIFGSQPEYLLSHRNDLGIKAQKFDITVQGLAEGEAYGIRSHTFFDTDKMGDSQFSSRDMLTNLYAENISIDVGGSRINKGIEASGKVEGNNADAVWTYNIVNITSDEVDITVAGDSADGTSYGVHAYTQPGLDATANVNIYTSDFTLDVSNPEGRSPGEEALGTVPKPVVGLLAENPESAITIQALEGSAISVEIRCTLTNSVEDIKGFAIEAYYGGNVSILGSSDGDYDDRIVIDGHILAINSISNDTAVDLLTYGGDDHIEINGDIELRGDASITIDGGAGDDTVILNGAVKFDDGIGPRLNITGGEGNDLLILKADSPEQFAEYYGEWLKQDGIFEKLSFEKITIEVGPNIQSDDAGLAWFVDLINEYNGANPDASIEWKIFSGAEDITPVGEFSASDSNYSFDGLEGNDLLYVKYDENDLLDSLSDAFPDGSINNAKGILLDMVDTGKDHSLNFDVLTRFMDSLGSEENRPKVFLHYDEGDAVDFTDSGWQSDGTETVNGHEYTVYTHQSEGEEVSLYVQLISSTGM